MTQSTVSPVSRKSCMTERPDAALTRLFLEHGDNHIPNVIVIIDDENVASLGPSSSDHGCSLDPASFNLDFEQRLGNMSVMYLTEQRRLDFYWYVLGR